MAATSGEFVELLYFDISITKKTDFENLSDLETIIGIVWIKNGRQLNFVTRNKVKLGKKTTTIKESLQRP